MTRGQNASGGEMNLEGVRMNVVAAAQSATISAETIFEFEQRGGVISARYRGGRIVDGYLIGRIDGGTLQFRYIQADTTGRLDAGQSEAKLTRNQDGRLRLIEHFQWATRSGTGANILAQVDEYR